MHSRHLTLKLYSELRSDYGVLLVEFGVNPRFHVNPILSSLIFYLLGILQLRRKDEIVIDYI